MASNFRMKYADPKQAIQYGKQKINIKNAEKAEILICDGPSIKTRRFSMHESFDIYWIVPLDLRIYDYQVKNHIYINDMTHAIIPYKAKYWPYINVLKIKNYKLLNQKWAINVRYKSLQNTPITNDMRYFPYIWIV